MSKTKRIDKLERSVSGKKPLAVVYIADGQYYQENPFTGGQALEPAELDKLRETKEIFELEYIREWRALD